MAEITKKLKGNFVTADSRMRFGVSDEAFHIYVDDHGDLLRGFVWVDQFFGFVDCTDLMKNDRVFLGELKNHYLDQKDDGTPDPMDLVRDHAVDNLPDDVA